MVLGHGMTRDGWATVVGNMITRGAKGTPADFETITDYLAKNLPPNSEWAVRGSAPSAQDVSGRSTGQTDRRSASSRTRENDLQRRSARAAMDAMARGTANAPDLVRSDVVLHDHYGNGIGPYLLHTHPASGARTSSR